MKLTEKQKWFCDEYIRLGEATQAAINAGYSVKTAKNIGSENLTKPHLKAYIDERLERLKKESIAEQDEILQFLTKVVRGELTEEIPVGMGDGYQELKDKEPYLKDRIKAAEMLGKRYVMWTERHQVDGDVQVQIIDDIPSDKDG